MTATDRPALTDQQRKIYAAIIAHVGDHMAPPGYRELIAATGVQGLNAVAGHLKALAKKGYIVLPVKGQARGIVVPGLAERVKAACDAFLDERGES